MKLPGFILKLMKNHIKPVYHIHRPRNETLSEHVLFVQMCPVFASPVTNCIMDIVSSKYIKFLILLPQLHQQNIVTTGTFLCMFTHHIP